MRQQAVGRRWLTAALFCQTWLYAGPSHAKPCQAYTSVESIVWDQSQYGGGDIATGIATLVAPDGCCDQYPDIAACIDGYPFFSTVALRNGEHSAHVVTGYVELDTDGVFRVAAEVGGFAASGVYGTPAVELLVDNPNQDIDPPQLVGFDMPAYLSYGEAAEFFVLAGDAGVGLEPYHRLHLQMDAPCRDYEFWINLTCSQREYGGCRGYLNAEGLPHGTYRPSLLVLVDQLENEVTYGVDHPMLRDAAIVVGPEVDHCAGPVFRGLRIDTPEIEFYTAFRAGMFVADNTAGVEFVRLEFETEFWGTTYPYWVRSQSCDACSGYCALEDDPVLGSMEPGVHPLTGIYMRNRGGAETHIQSGDPGFPAYDLIIHPRGESFTTEPITLGDTTDGCQRAWDCPYCENPAVAPTYEIEKPSNAAQGGGCSQTRSASPLTLLLLLGVTFLRERQRVSKS